jgi:hypothetical protein
MELYEVGTDRLEGRWGAEPKMIFVVGATVVGTVVISRLIAPDFHGDVLMLAVMVVTVLTRQEMSLDSIERSVTLDRRDDNVWPGSHGSCAHSRRYRTPADGSAAPLSRSAIYSCFRSSARGERRQRYQVGAVEASGLLPDLRN